uniref:DNA polymerase alpha subunit B n=1 Tax=Daucus carota subsp. sativus TaxID=79200 RepID=A0A165YAE5_DAUCS
MEEQIKSEFKKSGFTFDNEEEILQKCLAFCINYNLSPCDLVSSWDVYSLNRQLELTVQNAHMDAFLQQLQNEQKEAIIKKEPGLHLYSNDVKMILSDKAEDIDEVVPGTPTEKYDMSYLGPLDSAHKTNGSILPSGKPADLVTPFGQRKNKFVVQSTISDLPNTDSIKEEQHDNNSEDDIIKRVQPRKRCSLQTHHSKPETSSRFMYDRIEDKFNFLENRIMKHAKAFVASGIYEEPVDPTVASQKSLFAIGMVIGIKGDNPSGHCLIASEIIDHVPLLDSNDENSQPSKKQALDKDLIQTDLSHAQSEISALIAGGPFTTTDNLMFEPLTELLAYARRKQPQLLILLGPFIDSEHPEIKKGTVNQTFDELFHHEILKRIQDHVEYMGSAARVILVPSIRDASHDFVFPQPPFSIHPPDLKDQITSITNPGTFSANEVKVACCTVDIIKQLSGEEISRNAAGGSKHRMSTLANHILCQRRHVVSVGGEGEAQKKCLCVNPGRLARGEGGGFFVELNYHGSPESATASVIRI